MKHWFSFMKNSGIFYENTFIMKFSCIFVFTNSMSHFLFTSSTWSIHELIFLKYKMHKNFIIQEHNTHSLKNHEWSIGFPSWIIHEYFMKIHWLWNFHAFFLFTNSVSHFLFTSSTWSIHELIFLNFMNTVLPSMHEFFMNYFLKKLWSFCKVKFMNISWIRGKQKMW